MKSKHSRWRLYLDDTEPINDRTWERIMANDDFIRARLTRKSVDRLAQNLANKYKTAYYYMQLVGKNKRLRKAFIVQPVLAKDAE